MIDAPADRPALDNDDIEITPEMIEAGVVELSYFNRDFEDDADAVTRIYSAMRARAVG